MGSFLNSLMLAVINFFFPPAAPPPSVHLTTTPPGPVVIDHGGVIGERFALYLMYLNLNRDSFERFKSSRLSHVRYYAFYFSGEWCPPSAAFTPELVDFYDDFKPTHPNFELIFVSADETEADMEKYMRDDSMPWPAVDFAAYHRGAPLGLEKYETSFIPNLVLADSDGNILSSTHVNDSPEHVIDDIRAMVPKPSK